MSPSRRRPPPARKRAPSAPARRAPHAAGAGREELLAAAADEFAAHGYAGATTAGIARRAGVTQPLVHHHFGSKEGLWLAVVDALFGGLEEALARAAAEAPQAPSPGRLGALIAAFVRYSGEHPELARLVRAEGSGGGPAFELLYARRLEKLVAFFRQELDRAREAGVLRVVDPALLYFVVVGACTEPFAQPEVARRVFGLDATRPEVVERHAAAITDLLLHGTLA